LVLCVIYESREILEGNSQPLTDHREGCSQHKIDHLIQQSQSVQINLIGLNQIPVGGKGTFVTLNSLLYGVWKWYHPIGSFMFCNHVSEHFNSFYFSMQVQRVHIPVHLALSEMVLLRGDNLTGVQ